MILKDNCFIIQHIVNKAQFYCRKAGDDLYLLLQFSPTDEITYIAGYLLTTDDEYLAHHGHIWAVLQCVE